MKTIHNRNYGTIPVGVAVRGQIAKTWIYRVRHGNGYYTSILGAEYQDKYAYVLPSGYETANVGPARNAFIAAVANWQGFSEEVKQTYKDRAAAMHLRMSGYNLYIREYMKANG